MVASVQELILAANAKRDESPLIGLVKSLAGGLDSYQAAKSTAIQDLVRQKAAQKAQQEIDYQRALENEYKAQEVQKEQALKNTFNGLPESKTPAFPVSRMEREIVRGSKGFEIVEPKNTMTIPPSVMPYVQKGDLEGLTQELGDVPIEIARLATANRAQTGVQNRFETTSDMRVKEGKARSTEKLRDDYTSQSKSFNDYTEAYQRINSTAEDPSPAGDLALIYNFAKMMDERGAVREQDFIQVAKTGALGDQIKSLVLKNATGERLPDNIRKDLVDRARRIYEGQKLIQEEKKKFYSGLAQDAGVDPSKVTPDFSPKSLPSQSSGATWDDSKESRYQELLRKRGGK